MNLTTSLCIPYNTPGLGGVAGGGGFLGQPSESAQGFSSKSYGIPIIRTTTGVTAKFTIRLTKDIQGTVPSDLIDVSRVQFVCLDQNNPKTALFTKQCQIKTDGFVQLQLGPEQIDNKPGIHYSLINCFDQQSKLIKTFKCILQVQRGFYGCSVDLDPLSVNYVRTAIYDTCAAHNVLLDDLQFSDFQIIYCMQRAVDSWNDMPPSLYDKMTISNFPYKAKLCTGTMAYLFTTAAYRYIRNQMRHSNAGLTYDDQAKGQSYIQLGQMNKQQWDSWTNNKKTQLNMNQCMGTISDIYHQSDIQRWWY